MEKLLIAAVADADVAVRHSIFSSLHGNRGFDDFLAQADSLSAVFAALNDEVSLDERHFSNFIFLTYVFPVQKCFTSLCCVQ